MSILSAEDGRFFDENGYVVVRDAVPQDNRDAVIEAIWEFTGMDPNDSEDWYRPPLATNGMIEMYQHQALWDNRQHPRVHQAFADILGTEKLWVSFDRVGLKPPAHPAHPEYDHKGFIHWDLDTSKPPPPLSVQGVLCLTDTSADMGGFQCIPGFHRDLEAWIKTQPSGRNPHVPDLKSLPPGRSVQPIPARAGDLIIWNRQLAHGNGHNRSNKPRLAQYLTMFPAGSAKAVFGREAEGEERIRQWRERLSPQANWAPGDPRRWEELHGKTAELTPLGRKLLGLDLWD